MAELIGDLERAFAAALYPNRVPIAIGLLVAAVVLAWYGRRRGWHLAARRHPRRTIAAVAVLLAVGLPVGWYLGSPLFIRTQATDAPTSGGEVVASGEFVGADEFHFGQGTAQVVRLADGSHVVRFSSFSVRNGPDLFVYLSPDPAGYVDGAIELGTLKATDGAFEYAVPGGSDPLEIRSVVVWCKAFSVQFAVAALVPAA